MNHLFALMPIFAQNGGTERGGQFIQTLILLGAIVLFSYFILFRPEKKRRKALEARRNAMKKGDKVTAMGIIGTVDKIQDQSVILNMVDGAKIEVLKAAISDIQSSAEAKPEETEKNKAT